MRLGALIGTILLIGVVLATSEPMRVQGKPYTCTPDNYYGYQLKCFMYEETYYGSNRQLQCFRTYNNYDPTIGGTPIRYASEPQQ